MEIIEKISLLWKAWRRTLSIEEFSFLVGLISTRFRDTDEYAFAAKVLKKYFRGNLKQKEADVLASSLMEAQDFWLESVRGKMLSDIETELLIKRLPWYFTWNFPVRLSEKSLEILFSEQNPEKIVAYCRDYCLPKRFEDFLLEKYQQSLTNPDGKMQYVKIGGRRTDGWAEALETYLHFGSDERFVSKDMQKKLLSLNNARLTSFLIKRCSIAKNILDEEIICSLIGQHNEEAMRLLLLESFLPNIQKTGPQIEQEMPQLKAQLEIAQYRRKLYFKEQKYGVNLGVLTLLPQESNIIRNYLLSTEYEKESFAEEYILPWIGGFRPCMCAYVAYYFPHLADKALEEIKFFASICKK
jgi:hypothetical protein